MTEPATEATAQLDELADAFAARLGQLMRDLARHVEGPSRTQHSVLARLADDGPQRITDLAAAERVAQPSMTTLVSRLEQAGWVERGHDPRDGRAVVVALTAVGRKELTRIRTARRRLLADRLARLSTDEQRGLRAALPALDKLIDGR